MIRTLFLTSFILILIISAPAQNFDSLSYISKLPYSEQEIFIRKYLQSGDRINASLLYFNLSEAAEDNGDFQISFQAQKRIGNLMHSMYNFNEAVDYYYKVLHHPEQRLINDTLKAHLNYNIGLAARQSEEDSLSLVYTTRSKVLYEKLGLQNHLADALIGLGILDWKKENYTSARSYYNRALSLVDANSRIAAKAYNNLGNAYLKELNYEKARELLTKALSIHPISETYNNLGEIYLQFDQLDSAKFFFKKTLELIDITTASVEGLSEYDRSLNELINIFKIQKSSDYFYYNEIWRKFMTHRVEQLELSHKLSEYMTGRTAIAEIARIKEEKKRLRAEHQLSFWIVSAIIVAFLSALLYLQFLRRRKKDLERFIANY